jgi:hypothetical protein
MATTKRVVVGILLGGLLGACAVDEGGEVDDVDEAADGAGEGGKADQTGQAGGPLGYDGYRLLRNGRFGYEVLVPRHWSSVVGTNSTNGDGLHSVPPASSRYAGLELLGWGSHTDLATEYGYLLSTDPGETVTSAIATPLHATVTTVRGDRATYVRAIRDAADGLTAVLRFEYPAGEDDLYLPIIRKITSSFAFGAPGADVGAGGCVAGFAPGAEGDGAIGFDDVAWYRNGRFGFALAVPADFEAGHGSPDGDGNVFVAPVGSPLEGVEILAYAGHADLAERFGYMAIEHDGERVTRALARPFHAITSGTDGDRAFVRLGVGAAADGPAAVVAVEYPSALRVEALALVDRIEASFDVWERGDDVDVDPGCP